MHALNAYSFIIIQKFYFRVILFLFLGCFLYSPVEVRFCDKVGQSDHRNPVEVFLASIVDSGYAVLPPEALQRWYDIIEIPFNLMISFFTHLDRKGNAIKESDRPLIFAVFLIRISMTANCDIVHARNRHDRWFVLRHIEFLIFFFIVKSHYFPLVSDTPHKMPLLLRLHRRLPHCISNR